ncbi:MAG: guanylate kinase [Pseudomonadota bacterium]
MNNSNQGLVIVISSPSGAGKSTLVRNLMSFDPNLRLSTSFTTRPPRRGEINGRDYHFVEENEFKQKIAVKDFIEHTEIFGYHYGTDKKEVTDLLNTGRDVIFDLDWYGQRQILEHFCKNQVCSVFVLPPSLNALKDRLESRALDSPDEIKKRFNNAKDEIKNWRCYSFTLVNDDIDHTIADLQAIIRTKRLERFTENIAPKFVKQLNSEKV